MHLTLQELRAALRSTDGASPVGGAPEHLAGCPVCLDALHRLRESESATLSSGIMPALGAELEPALEVGQRLGRYVLVGRLGEGGMGLVYAAYDPSLDRRVAIKVLRPGTASQAYLLAEAQLLAKLRHPNVVSVHDVGTTASGQLFMALDYLEGQTAKAWLKSAPRSPEEILAVFMQAGRGLSEAHRLGIVHRDFKPDNLLVDASGRGFVLDFGIALGSQRPEEQPLGPSPVQTAGSELSTKAGQLKGTLPYLPPEVFTGQRADAHSDQFSFCVSLYEALFGVRPFDTQAVGEARWALVPPPEGREVSAPIRAAVLRGLEPEAAKRWPSMGALLEALSTRRTPRGLVLAAAAALVLVGGAGVAALRRPDPCVVGARGAREAFSQEAQSEAAARFAATALPYAEGTFTVVARSLDAFAQGWEQRFLSVCRAPTRGTEGHALQLECLDQRRASFSRLVGSFQRATSDTVDRAVQMAAALPDLEGCDDTEALRRSAWVGASVAQRQRAEALRRELEALEFDFTLGPEERLVPLRALKEEARALKHHTLVAYALLIEGRLGTDRRQMLAQRWEAFTEAYRARDYRLQVRGAHDLINDAYNTGNSPLVRPVIDMAEAAFVAAGEPASLKLELLRLRSGAALGTAQDAEGATRALVDELMRRDDLMALSLRSVTFNNLAVAVGDRHERFSEAVDALRQALEAGKLFPKPGLMPFIEYVNLIEYAGSAGRFDEALAAGEDFNALAAKYPKVPGEMACHRALQLANLERYRGETARSRAHLEAARACAAGYAMLETPSAIVFELAESDLQRLEGHPDQALASARRALAVGMKYTGADSYETARAQLNLAQALLETGKTQGAQEALEPVLAFVDKVKPSEGGLLVPGLWRTRGALLLASGGDQVEGQALLKRARAAFEALHHSAAVARIDGWLAKVK